MADQEDFKAVEVKTGVDHHCLWHMGVKYGHMMIEHVAAQLKSTSVKKSILKIS